MCRHRRPINSIVAGCVAGRRYMHIFIHPVEREDHNTTKVVYKQTQRNATLTDKVYEQSMVVLLGNGVSQLSDLEQKN